MTCGAKQHQVPRRGAAMRVGGRVGRVVVRAEISLDLDDASGQHAMPVSVHEQLAQETRRDVFWRVLKESARKQAARQPVAVWALWSLFVRFLPFLEQGQHFFRVAFGRDLGKDVQQGLVGADQERGPLDAPHLLAVHVLFLQHAKLIADFLVYISKECVRQVVLGAEFGLGLGRVAADAEHHGAGGLELLEGVAEAAGLNGAARSVGSGIKEEYDGLAGIVRQAYGFVLVGLQREIGDFAVQFHGEYSSYG